MVVEFDVTEFRELYPKFTETVATDTQLEYAFQKACIILNNTDKSIVPYDPDNGVYTRKVMLYLLTCHIMTLSLWSATGQSGAVSSASEGSVSTSFNLPTSAGGDWFKQTECGYTFWQMIQAYNVGGRYYSIKYVHPWG